jgi:hypothetical protein
VKSSKVKVEGALSGDDLDGLIVKFVPLMALLDVIKIMTRLCTGSFMDENSIEFINVFFAGSCPFSEIQDLIILKSR